MNPALSGLHRPPSNLDLRVKAICHRLLNTMREQGREIGWAVASHGSMIRDLDIVATPWTETACSKDEFIASMRLAVVKELNGECYVSNETVHPYGRRTVTLHANSPQIVRSRAGAHPYVDLSFIDTRVESESI